MSEVIKDDVPEILKPQRKTISTTMIKKIRALSKDQLVKKLIDVHNYAEVQKAANSILMYQVKQLNEKLNGKPQDAVASTIITKEVKDESGT